LWLELAIGPISTNGGTRTVSVSFSRGCDYWHTYMGGGIDDPGGALSLGGGSNSATIQIFRKVGSAEEVLWETVAVTGFCDLDGDYAFNHVTAEWAGAKTITDTSPAGQDVRYRALISAFEQQSIYGEITFQKVKPEPEDHFDGGGIITPLLIEVIKKQHVTFLSWCRR